MKDFGHRHLFRKDFFQRWLLFFCLEGFKVGGKTHILMTPVIQWNCSDNNCYSVECSEM